MDFGSLSLIDRSHLAELPFEVRSATFAINISDCADRNLHRLCEGVYQKITRLAARFAETVGTVSAEYGVPVLQRRLSVTGVTELADGFGPEDLLHVARTLEGAAANVHVDRIGGFSADARYGLSTAASQIISSLPLVLTQTSRVRAAVQVASSETGVNLSAISLIAQKLREAAEASADRNGDAAARLTIVANQNLGYSHLTSCTTQPAWPDRSIHVSLGAAAVLKRTLERLSLGRKPVPWTAIAEHLQVAAFRAIRASEIVGREIAHRLKADFGFIDPTLAPTIRADDSVLGLLPLLGVGTFGAPGTTAALALLHQVMNTAAQFAAPGRVLPARVMLSVLEDPVLAEATHAGQITLDQLGLYAAAGSCGLDLIPLPGETDVDTLGAIIADQMALAVSRNQSSSVRLIPIPGKSAGERVTYGSMLGEATILPISGIGHSKPFLQRSGLYPLTCR